MKISALKGDPAVMGKTSTGDSHDCDVWWYFWRKSKPFGDQVLMNCRKWRVCNHSRFLETDCHRATIRILTSVLWNQDQGQAQAAAFWLGLLLQSICPWGLKLFLTYLRHIFYLCVAAKNKQKEKKIQRLLQNALPWRQKMLTPPHPCSKGTLSPRE